MSLKLTGQLVRERRFVPLWMAQTLGAFNDNLFRYALVTMAAYGAIDLYGMRPEEMAPIAATAFTLPIFLFSALAGQVSDKFDRNRIMRVTKFIEIWLMGIAAAGFILNQPGLLILTLFLMGAQSAFFIPARNSALPTLLQSHELVTANAIISGTVNIAILAGAIGGTLLVAYIRGPVAIGGILIGMAIVGWLAMRQGLPAPVSNPDMKVRWNIVAESIRIIGFAWRAQHVFRALAGVAWFWMLAATVITILPVFARQVLGVEQSVVAIFQLLFTLGAAGGALITGTLSRGGEARMFVLIGAIGLVIFPLDITYLTWGQTAGADLISASAFIDDPTNRRIMIDLALSAASGGMFVVPLQAMAQRRAEPEKRGRILAASGIMNGLSASLGQFVLWGLAQGNAPLQGGFIFVALGSSIAAIYTLTRLVKPPQSSQSSN